jgi:hypothetical protein
MSESDTDRQKITVTHKGKTTDYYARELGYFEYQDIDASLSHMPIKTDAERNRKGLEQMKLITVASIEHENGKQAFTEVSLKKLHRDVARPLSDAAMLAQGIDMEKIRREAVEAELNKTDEDITDEAAVEGNG